MSTTAARGGLMAAPLTANQRRAIFAAGRAHGLDLEALRAATPAGSISMLSRSQAAELLDRLNSGTAYEHPRQAQRGRRRPKGVHAFATQAQRNKLKALQIDLGWSDEELRGWLSERHYAGTHRAMTQIDSTQDGVEVIELLRAVLARTRQASTAGLQAMDGG